MNIENGLITKVVETGDYKIPVRARITENYFTGSGKAIWGFILKHAQDYRKSPTAEALQREFPDWMPETTTEPLEYFIDELKKRQRFNLILEAMNGRVFEAMQGHDSMKAQAALFDLVSRLNTEVNQTEDINLAEFAEELMARYEFREQNLGLIGIPFPWDLANEATGGMDKKQLIVLAAKSGVGKTWFEVILMLFAAMAGYRVLFISKEVDAPPIAERTVSAGFKLPYGELRSGRLGEQGKQIYFRKLKEDDQRDWMKNIIISADTSAGDSLLAIQSKVEEHNPDIVFIDGAYLIEEKADSDWVRIGKITRGLKQMSRRMNMPFVISNQLSRKVKEGQKADQDSVAFGSSFYNDSDVVIFLYQSEEQQEVKKMVAHFDKVREGKGPSLMLNWDFDTMDFSMAGDMTGMPIDGEGGDDDVLKYA